MMAFLNAHGFDPGPSQRPMLAGAITGLLATVPAAALFVGFGTFQAVADEIVRLPRGVTAAILIPAFVLAGAVYGRLFGRAANDRRGGWIFGLAFGLLLWVAAPVLVLPLIPGPGIAAGEPAKGFLAGFLAWGIGLGALFPFVHRPLHAGLSGEGGAAGTGGSRSA